MSYPGPPGASKGASHPSLPPRPPATKLSGFKPAFSAAPSVTTYSTPSPIGYPVTTAPPSYSSAGYGAPGSYGLPPSTAPYMATAPGAPALGVSPGGYNQASPYSYPQQPQQQGYQQQQPYYGAPATAASYAGAPQIRNPFPAPSTQAVTSDYNPEVAAQIAQWQSAYMPKDPSEPSIRGPAGAAGRAGNIGAAGAAGQAYGVAVDASNTGGQAGEKKKTVYREGGGKKWQDDSLLEWDPSHLRLFVGNLAGETTDESLYKAFSRWKSIQKAKVVRDKRTTKSKGFGFVSFSDPEDFFQAAKEMNGKYIQSHPVTIRKAKTEIKAQVVKEDRRGARNHKRSSKPNEDNKNKSGSGVGDGKDSAPYEPALGPIGGGITKPGQKTRGGLRLLG
ncbi:hypothetical protein B0T26DRAFT_658454 [Lasiosphaeria miniovina]|uniref:RRM domain-containing protein n=1 Tax=Lasiosphaeria miniovina TaxID=1954250 RepID=A0AA39ZUD9_9PEZI|nr:uncharacterized protein B0T26DRAFT_658454 [Lasiosphaeria miniovina]KAK0703725.1 hypothetical protein B0T26DRAFT_658454 [Lasiosphaeria miniovina]